MQVIDQVSVRRNMARKPGMLQILRGLRLKVAGA
jgi:hypothetical protein